MEEKIDFGTVGIKIYDRVTFIETGDVFIVGSGRGVPGNGGTLLGYENNPAKGLFSIRCITKLLQGQRFNNNIDLFELWTYEGRTLRSMHNANTHASGDK